MDGHIRTSLYKYVTFEVLVKIIETCRFQVSSPRNFDDPWECSAGIMLTPLVEEQVSNIVSCIDKICGHGAYEKLPLTQQKDINKKILESTLQSKPMNKIKSFQNIQARLDNSGILCFSEVDNSPPLWSQYGDFNKGAVIEIDLEKSRELGLWLSTAQPVVYSHKAARDFKTAVFTKSIDWSYQKEWRVVIAGIFGAENEKKVAFMEFDPEEIKSIILGVNTTEEQIEKLKAVICSRRLRHVKLHKMEVHQYRYEYIKKEI